MLSITTPKYFVAALIAVDLPLHNVQHNVFLNLIDAGSVIPVFAIALICIANHHHKFYFVLIVK